MRRGVLLLLILLVSCQPTYIPDQSVLATREAVEYANRMIRVDMAWQLTSCFSIIAIGIMLFFLGSLAWFYAGDRNSRKKFSDAKARREMLVDIGGNKIIDLETQEMYEGTQRIMLPINRIVSSEPLLEPDREPSLATFVVEAAAVSEDGWDATAIPRWDRWVGKFRMTAAEWMRLTDPLQKAGLIDKKHGRNTMVVYDHDLRWLYNQLTHPEEKE